MWADGAAHLVCPCGAARALHLQVMNAARMEARAMAGTLDTELDGARGSAAAKEYFKTGSDVDQNLEESWEMLAAFAVRCCEACISQMDVDEKSTITAHDVEDYMDKRKSACPLFALRLAGWRNRVAICAMDDSPRNTTCHPRGDIDLCHRMQDLLTVTFAAFGTRQ